MPERAVYAALADGVLVLHFALVLFVVLGLPLFVIGHRRGWRWANGWSLRVAHGLAIGVVVAQSWLGQTCPLTTLEQWLRWRAGVPTHEQSFIAHWLQRLLFYEAPEWVFVLVYSVFGACVLWVWWRCPPRRRGT